MSDPAKYIRYTWFVLFMVIMVIIAGGVVRMTQSGMGCPDWPTCFGRWIPPTDASQLPPDFEKYLSKQDIDHSFNVYHTWIEYINRLLGALLGIFIFIHFIWSLRRYGFNNKITYLSLFLLLLTGFQGWLGKTVVDANLSVVKVTIHMLVALVIAAVPLLIIYRVRREQQVIDRSLKVTAIVVLLLLIGQIVLGTEVREQIDHISKAFAYEQRDKWIAQLDYWFVVHRSFSWTILAGCLWLGWLCGRRPVLRKNGWVIAALAILSVLLGISMQWFDIPAIAQPLHLLSANLLALSVFTLNIRVKSR